MPEPLLCSRCGKYSSPEAKFCQACGRSFQSGTRRSSAFSGMILLLLILGVCTYAVVTTDHSVAPSAPLTKEQQEAEHVSGVIYACKVWTKANSKLAVEDFVDEFQIAGKRKANHYRVGLKWRTKGPGLLMESDCTYLHAGGNYLLVEARSDLAK